MWIVAWEDIYGEKLWEVVNDQDAVHRILHELEKSGITKNIMVGQIHPAYLENN